MTTRRLAFAAGAALVGALVLAGCQRDTDDETVATPPAMDEPAAAMPAEQPVSSEMPTAVNVSSVTLGTAAGADRKIATPMTTFAARDPIVVSIETDGAASNANVTVKLIDQDDQTIDEQTQTISPTGMETTNVTFTNADGWPTGSYRAEVWINDTLARSTDFTVS